MVTYEWDIETIDPESGDILDHNFNDDLFALLPEFVPQDKTMRLCLVRNEGNDLDGLTDRMWGYVDDNWFLPTYFEYADDYETDVKVPKKFHQLIARASTR